MSAPARDTLATVERHLAALGGLCAYLEQLAPQLEPLLEDLAAAALLRSPADAGGVITAAEHEQMLLYLRTCYALAVSELRAIGRRSALHMLAGADQLPL
jgi:hypothetical protein